MFGREQYLKKDGTPDFGVKVFRVTSLAKMAEGIQPPKDKVLKLDAPMVSGGGIDINDDDLPF